MSPAKIVLLPGDGIGPEVVGAACEVIKAAAGVDTFVFETHLLGGIAIDQTGQPLPESTLAACRKADAIFLGAVGGPKWDDPNAKVRPEQGLLGLRKALELFANIRPVRTFEGLEDLSPVKLDRAVDFVIVRELTGGAYFGTRGRDGSGEAERAYDTMAYTRAEVRRVAERAFAIARGRRKQLCSIDKANVLESSRLWRTTVEDVARNYPDVALSHQLVDSAAMRLITHPTMFDVIVTENLFGDILSDEASVLAGSLGLLPSASLGVSKAGLYEPIHGSAPDIAGKGFANPIAAISSAAMMLRYSFDHTPAADAIDRAVTSALRSGIRTRDLGGTASTDEMRAAVIRAL